MEITAVETIGLTDLKLEETGWVGEEELPHERLLFVRLHTGTDVIGVGETYPRPSVDAAVIHDCIAPVLLGEDPGEIERLWRETYRRANGWGGFAGAEMRSLSAVDIALWDLKGKALGTPIYDLLGGKTRDSMPTYNTCYEREYSFNEEPVELAESLLEDGISAMKIWPYDEIAYANEGNYISQRDLKAGAEPLKAIREAVGDEMEVAMEFHGLWNASCAKKIATHLEQYDPMWLEELIEIGDLHAYADVADATSLPVNASERLMNKFQFNTLLSTADIDIAMFDLNRLGGFTEGKKTAAIAEAHHLPVAPHNCAGPITHFANLQFGAAIPNLMTMESVRGRYDGWHRRLVTTPATASEGRLDVPEGPGLGTELADSVLDADGVDRRITRISE